MVVLVLIIVSSSGLRRSSALCEKGSRPGLDLPRPPKKNNFSRRGESRLRRKPIDCDVVELLSSSA
jgi:hypothetical protein